MQSLMDKAILDAILTAAEPEILPVCPRTPRRSFATLATPATAVEEDEEDEQICHDAPSRPASGLLTSPPRPPTPAITPASAPVPSPADADSGDSTDSEDENDIYLISDPFETLHPNLELRRALQLRWQHYVTFAQAGTPHWPRSFAESNVVAPSASPVERFVQREVDEMLAWRAPSDFRARLQAVRDRSRAPNPLVPRVLALGSGTEEDAERERRRAEFVRHEARRRLDGAKEVGGLPKGMERMVRVAKVVLLEERGNFPEECAVEEEE